MRPRYRSRPVAKKKRQILSSEGNTMQLRWGRWPRARDGPAKMPKIEVDKRGKDIFHVGLQNNCAVMTAQKGDQSRGDILPLKKARC